MDDVIKQVPYGIVAQQGELLTFNEKGAGASPAGPTKTPWEIFQMWNDFFENANKR